MSPRTASKDPEFVSTRRLSELVGLTVQHLTSMEKDGVIKRSGRDKWHLVETFRAFSDHMRSKRDEARYKSATKPSQQVAAARTLEIELRTKERSREVIPMEEAFAYQDLSFGMLRTFLSGLPSRCTRDLTLRRKIELEINIGLERVSRDVRKAGQAVREGIPLAEAFSQDDADAVGEEEQDVSPVDG